ncbi:MAG: hypothetical protein MHPSP_004740, partial [Paramarteilia canceri]
METSHESDKNSESNQRVRRIKKINLEKLPQNDKLLYKAHSLLSVVRKDAKAQMSADTYTQISYLQREIKDYLKIDT